jgi:choline dehydrogenase-like flavoprotein
VLAVATDPDRVGGDLLIGRADLLRAVLDTIVPADDYPSASQAGGVEYLTRLLAERPEWTSRVARALDAAEAMASPRPFAELDQTQREAVVAAVAAGEDGRWLVEIVNAGFYADPGNGGNTSGVSWAMVGWDPAPSGGWPVLVPVSEPVRSEVTVAGLLDRYDAIVVGSGAGGGVAACLLAESGRRVLVVEAGGWPSIAELSHDHLRNPRSTWGLEPLSGPTDVDQTRILDLGSNQLRLRPGDPAWSNNAFTAGGGTRVYGAQAWRFSPRDFAMASTYGVPAGSSLADWPIGYDDLEPFYRQAEWEIGVSGSGEPGPHQGWRSCGYPMPPLVGGPTRDRLAGAAEALGISTRPVPLLINSVPYLGRHRSARCRVCVGFACPVDAKNGSQNTMLLRAFATGRCSIILGTRAARLATDRRGRVVGVVLVGTEQGRPWRRMVDARQVILAAGAVETARLLLNSPTEQEPSGIGNVYDRVGRHLQGHTYGGAVGTFADEVEDLVGPGPAIATTDYQHDNPGVVGGGIIVNEFVPTPSNTYRYLVDTGLLPRFGRDAKFGMRRLARRMLRIMGPFQEVTTADARVRVDPSDQDRYKMPVARLSGGPHPEDLRGRDLISGHASAWLTAAGATKVVPLVGQPTGPSAGQHQAGTCGMGHDPATSVVDPWGRVWGHSNLAIADSSVHVTNGGVNPVLTILALAFRTTGHLVAVDP